MIQYKLNNSEVRKEENKENKENKEDKVSMKEIFAFKENGLSEQGEVRGEFIRYKHTPKVYDRMKRKGIVLEDIFGE